MSARRSSAVIMWVFGVPLAKDAARILEAGRAPGH